jgi:integrase/recombinase XerD
MARTKGYTDRVNILKKVLIAGNWKFVPAFKRNGKIVRDHVLVAGKDEHHPEGTYYIEWYEGTKNRRKLSVGTYDEALEAARNKSIEVAALKAGVLTQPVDASSRDRQTIGQAIDEYLEFVEIHRKKRTFLTYRYTLGTLLRESYPKTYVDEVSRQDMVKFISDCYRRGLGQRTTYDKLVVVLQMFKRYGKTKLLEPKDWPNYVETIRPIYEREELESMFKVATDSEATLVKFLLGSGFRDQEIRYVQWNDIDCRNHVVRVTAKQDSGFTPKNWEERAVPLPEPLIDRLKRIKEQRNAVPTQLVFANSRGNPDSYLDVIIKRLAHRAKLNCGRCITKHGNKCADGPYCMNYFLHKFRHTFATEHLRHGVDIRTLQSWMGHRDIQSTMVYLKGVQSKDAFAKVNGGALAAYVA